MGSLHIEKISVILKSVGSNSLRYISVRQRAGRGTLLKHNTKSTVCKMKKGKEVDSSMKDGKSSWPGG